MSHVTAHVTSIFLGFVIFLNHTYSANLHMEEENKRAERTALMLSLRFVVTVASRYKQVSATHQPAHNVTLPDYIPFFFTTHHNNSATRYDPQVGTLIAVKNTNCGVRCENNNRKDEIVS